MNPIGIIIIVISVLFTGGVVKDYVKDAHKTKTEFSISGIEK